MFHLYGNDRQMMMFATRNKRLANINMMSHDTAAFFWLEAAGGASSYSHFSCVIAYYGFTTRYVFFSIYDCWTVLSNLLAFQMPI